VSTNRHAALSWSQVAAIYNHRHPDEKDISRSRIEMIHRVALKKLAEKNPELAEELDSVV